MRILWIIHPSSIPPQQTPLNSLTQQTQTSLHSVCEGLVAVTKHCIAIICKEGNKKCMRNLSADHWTTEINVMFYEVTLFKVIFGYGYLVYSGLSEDSLMVEHPASCYRKIKIIRTPMQSLKSYLLIMLYVTFTLATKWTHY